MSENLGAQTVYIGIGCCRGQGIKVPVESGRQRVQGGKAIALHRPTFNTGIELFRFDKISVDETREQHSPQQCELEPLKSFAPMKLR